MREDCDFRMFVGIISVECSLSWISAMPFYFHSLNDQDKERFRPYLNLIFQIGGSRSYGSLALEREPRCFPIFQDLGLNILSGNLNPSLGGFRSLQSLCISRSQWPDSEGDDCRSLSPLPCTSMKSTYRYGNRWEHSARSGEAIPFYVIAYPLRIS